jgi:uncharacterized oligopeptide transporter (OPT) family protein
MNILAILLVVLLSVFGVGVMSYVAMATPLGPWLEPTMVLFAALLLKVIAFLGMRSLDFSQNHEQRVHLIVLIVVGSSIGGIIATAMGFSFPTLYFLDPKLFTSWMQAPIYFWIVTSGLALVGSLFGFWIASVLQDHMLVKQRLMFPVGQLAYRMILAQNQVRKAQELAFGFLITLFFCFGQAIKILPRYFSLLKSGCYFNFLNLPWVRFDFFPMYWAVGFVTGHVIAVPLLIGALAKIFLVDPINNLFFCNIADFEFMLAFGSGLMILGTVLSMIDAPRTIWETVRRIIKNSFFAEKNILQFTVNSCLGLFAIFFSTVFFMYLKMPWWVIIYLLLFTFVCSYQVIYIAGKIGLAQLGRFATFVMLPAVFLFSLDMVSIVFISTFVELSAGVAADVLFGLKLGQLTGVSSNLIKRYQFLGLLISSIVIGSIFWVLIHKFGLGTEELFVQRAQTRALLINVTKFNPIVVFLGMAFAYLLKFFNANPMLVLSGLLMPINVSLSLVSGGLFALWIKHKEEWYPFWSGVFASHSIWMVFSALLS